jgi:uncharacterized membrane protein YhaH (DUF805 family)
MKDWMWIILWMVVVAALFIVAATTKNHIAYTFAGLVSGYFICGVVTSYAMRSIG